MIDYQKEFQGKQVRVTLINGTQRVGVLLGQYKTNIYQLQTKVSTIYIPKKIVRKIEYYAG